MRLYLVQHGEALPKEIDPERPLSKEGRAGAERLAHWLGNRRIRVSRVLHSGKTRARQTAEPLAAALAPEAAVAARPGLGPNDATEAFAGEVGGWREDVLVVGHLPFMDRLVARLVTGREDAAIVAFRPGAIICLERAESGAWSVAWMLRPELL